VFEKRRRLMNEWATFSGKPKVGSAKGIQMQRQR
jgi:hypothetical protein